MRREMNHFVIGRMDEGDNSRLHTMNIINIHDVMQKNRM